MYNNSITDWLYSAKNEIMNISTSRVILILASIVFLVLMTQGRKIWLHFFHAIMFAEGIQHTFFPKTVGMFVTGDLDEVHILYIRTIGLLVLTWVLTYFLLSRSSDSTTDISFLLAISVMLLTSLLAMGHLWNYTPKKSKSATVHVEPEDVSLVFYGTLLLTAGTLFHLFRSSDWGGYAEQPSHANFHLRIEFVLLLAIGVVSYTMPSWVIRLQTSRDAKEIDAVHTFLVRAVGEAFLALAILTGRSANFLRNTDKDCVVVSQWMFFVVLAVWGWYGVITRWAELPWKRVAMQGIHDAVLILNATGALNRDLTVFKRVVLARFQAVPRDIQNYFKLKRL